MPGEASEQAKRKDTAQAHSEALQDNRASGASPSCGNRAKSIALSVSRSFVVVVWWNDGGVTVVVRDSPSVWAWLGPVLLFAAAMITLWVTNHRADVREWNKWRRDTLIELCPNALTLVQEAKSRSVAALNQTNTGKIEADRSAMFQAATEIGTLSERLYLMNANWLGKTCADMKAAANELYATAGVLAYAKINAGHRIDSAMKQLNEQGPSWFATPSPAYDEYRDKVSEIYKRIHDEMVAEPQSAYRQADSELERVRALFIERGRIELESTSR
jgi:hypothetical protein